MIAWKGNADSGIGFIRIDGETPKPLGDIPFFADCVRPGHRMPAEGSAVKFYIVEKRMGKVARDVRPVPEVNS